MIPFASLISSHISLSIHIVYLLSKSGLVRWSLLYSYHNVKVFDQCVRASPLMFRMSCQLFLTYNINMFLFVQTVNPFVMFKQIMGDRLYMKCCLLIWCVLIGALFIYMAPSVIGSAFGNLLTGG